MFTFQFDETSKLPKYEQLYQHVRNDIDSGALKQRDKLPSKRNLAAHLHVSLNTVEAAYAQLAVEGYIEPVGKKGYFVLPEAPGKPGSVTPCPKPKPRAAVADPAPPLYDLKNNTVDTHSFPFATWSRLMRDSLREDHAKLLEELEPQGDGQLREAIAEYLREYRNIQVSADQILLGAGTAYLLGILAELLPQAGFALEDPGYYMIARTLRSRNIPFAALDTDAEGLRPDLLKKSGASVCFLTPSNQFPLGTVMSIRRRMAVLEWADAKPDRYLIEDDYDSDYRYALKPAPALHSLARNDRVVYCNTFARTLTPSLRIAYLVLPQSLLAVYRPRRRFYSCTVSGFEQRTLWRFIKNGHYERHLNRMRTVYKKRRNVFLAGLSPLAGKLAVSGADAGLHLLLRSTSGLTETDMVQNAAAAKVRVYGLSNFYHKPVAETNTVIAGYAGLAENDLKEATALLCEAWR